MWNIQNYCEKHILCDFSHILYCLRTLILQSVNGIDQVELIQIGLNQTV